MYPAGELAVLRQLLFTFLCRIWIIVVSQQYCENFRKFEQAELVSAFKLPTQQISA